MIRSKSSNTKLKSPRVCAAMISLALVAQPLWAQQSSNTALEAEAAPKSILFPSGVPGPYFPTDDEIASAAEDRLGQQPEGQGLISDPTGGISQEKVDVAELIEADKSAYGTIAQADGGLAKTIWQPSSYQDIETLLNALNLPSKSPAMDDIARKLLLSFTSAPTGEAIREEAEAAFGDDNFQSISQQYDAALLKKFINLRINELIERGNLADLVLFIQNLPEGTLEPVRQNAEILLLGGDLIGACQMTQTARTSAEQENNRQNRFSTISNAPDDRTNEEEIFWLKMLSFCRVLEENNSGAQIALDMLNEQGATDYVFIDLLNRLMAGPSQTTAFLSGGLTSLDSLNYTILSLLDQPIAVDLIENSTPLVVSALVINPNMSAEARFQAAVKSYQSGGISVDVLRNIYELQEFTEVEYSNAVRLAQFDERPLADALLHQAASKKATDSEKAEILNLIWQRAIENNDLPRMAALNIETLMSLSPSSGLINHSHHISRGLILGGELDGARQWYDFARRNAAGGDGEATRALINIWPLAILAGNKGDIPWSENILNLWWNGQMVLAPESRDGKAALFYALAEAFEYPVSEEKWAELVTENHPENVQPIPLAVWRELIRSVGSNKQAEAIILSLIAMGKDGPGSLDASGISTIVRALRSFGLEREARKVAVEALVANGF